MRLLLDTHVFLWCVKNDRRLTKTVKNKIIQAQDVYVSSASIWEMVIKIKLKKLDVKIDEIVNSVSESGFTELPVTINHAAGIARLAEFHKDPFDRILIAQAMYEPLTFLTADAQLKQYSELVELVD